MPTIAYEGFNARFSGKPILSNPYSWSFCDSKLADLWEIGYMMAETTLRTGEEVSFEQAKRNYYAHR